MRALATSAAITFVALTAVTAAAAPVTASQIEPLLARCLAVADNPASQRGAGGEFQAPHRVRMYTICSDWRHLARSSGDRTEAASRLLARCLSEAAAGPVRFDDAAFQAHVRNGRATCRRLYAATSGPSS